MNRTAREKCYPWQGKVLSMDNNSPATVRGYDGRVYEVTNIKDTSYGLPDGLWGINCHHSPANVFIPGMCDVHGLEYMPSEEENRRMYALTQEQRKLEREVRLNKREAAMLHASGDKEGFQNAAVKLKHSEDKLKYLIDSHTDILVKNSDRTRAFEYNKNVNENIRQMLWIQSVLDKAKEVSGIKGSYFLGSIPVDCDSLLLNDQHVIARNHNVDCEEAISFIKNAVVTVVRWNGKRKLYFSESGAAYVAHEEKIIETAFRSSEYDDKTKKLMEVIVNALSSRK